MMLENVCRGRNALPSPIRARTIFVLQIKIVSQGSRTAETHHVHLKPSVSPVRNPSIVLLILVEDVDSIVKWYMMILVVRLQNATNIRNAFLKTLPAMESGARRANNADWFLWFALLVHASLSPPASNHRVHRILHSN